MSTVALITVVHGRHQHLENQGRTVARGTRHPDLRIVVAMDDPGLERPDADVLHLGADAPRLPLAAARNLGADHAIALGADVLVFLDVDCLAGAGLIEGYAHAVEESPGVVWSGPVSYLPPAPPGGYDLTDLRQYDEPHPGRPAPRPEERLINPRPELFWSLSFALHHQTWSRIGGFCEEYQGYGGEDTDFGLLTHHRGLRHGWTGDARAYHQHHEVETPPVQHLDAILRNGAVFNSRWGHWPMTAWLTQFEELGLVCHDDGHWRRAS